MDLFAILYLDKMEFDVYETQTRVSAKQRPIVIITSNNEKELPDAFLRRCFFHYIDFPDHDQLAKIVEAHYPGIKQTLLNQALTSFLNLRSQDALKKKPSTSELLDWLKLLLIEDLDPAELAKAEQKGGLLPFYGALIKNEQDVATLERVAFMSRR